MSLYPFIEAEKAQQRTLKRACELLEVSRAAYYAHRASTPRHASAPTSSSPSTSARSTMGPRAATGLHVSTLNCVDAAAGTPASGWRG